jgi:hypothetical protein
VGSGGGLDPKDSPVRKGCFRHDSDVGRRRHSGCTIACGAHAGGGAARWLGRRVLSRVERDSWLRVASRGGAGDVCVAQHAALGVAL